MGILNEQLECAHWARTGQRHKSPGPKIRCKERGTIAPENSAELRNESNYENLSPARFDWLARPQRGDVERLQVVKEIACSAWDYVIFRIFQMAELRAK